MIIIKLRLKLGLDNFIKDLKNYAKRSDLKDDWITAGIEMQNQAEEALVWVETLRHVNQESRTE